MQPLIGILSDRCLCAWGRRKPFILMLALIIFTASIILPLSRDVGGHLGTLFGSSPALITAIVTITSVIVSLNGK